MIQSIIIRIVELTPRAKTFVKEQSEKQLEKVCLFVKNNKNNFFNSYFNENTYYIHYEHSVISYKKNILIFLFLKVTEESDIWFFLKGLTNGDLEIVSHYLCLINGRGILNGYKEGLSKR